jgi:hypothetical protein
MRSAAATAMRLWGQYKTTSKVNLEPGKMQNLMGVAMSVAYCELQRSYGTPVTCYRASDALNKRQNTDTN